MADARVAVTHAAPRRRWRARRGSALILVLLMTLAVAALAVAAIFMTSSAGLLSRFYDRERLFALSAESGLELVLSRLRTDPDLVIADTGMTVLLAGVPIEDADGVAIAGASVFVYAMVTGDTTPTGPRTISFVARAYDSFGTRHVRRMDVRQESLIRFALLVDSFPSGMAYGPTTLHGPAHSNGEWRSANNSVYLDSVTAVGSFSGGSGTYAGDSLSGVAAIPFPRDSTFSWMATTAATGNLSYAPAGTGRTRVEFVTLDANADGGIDATEGYVRVFSLAAARDTSLLSVDPPISGSGPNARHDWREPIVQNQCGAFYLRSGRWHFFPVATHRATWAWGIIASVGSGDYPAAPVFSGSDGDDRAGREATKTILAMPTSRCFPAGSPYLVNTERMTDASGVVSANPDDNQFPWGARSAQQYGGSDTTFTRNARTCAVDRESGGGECDDAAVPLGAWQPFGGTPDAALPDSLRASHWPLHPSRNPGSTGLVNVSGSTFVSGVVRGAVTLRVGGAASIVDQLTYESDPNDPSTVACTDMLGLVATGDILVTNNALTRVRRYGDSGPATRRYLLHLGAEQRLSVHAHLLSTGGTVGVQDPDESIATPAEAIDCPAPVANSRASGGCFAHTGSAAMRVYSPPFAGSPAIGGLRPFPIRDRCQATGARPPYFPASNGYRVLRTVVLEPSRANTNERIEALLRSLRGRDLD